MQQQNLLKQQCQSHQQEVVAFDLDPLAELKDRYFCLDCLATATPYRQTKIIRDAQQKFKEMTMSEFNNKTKQIKQNIAKLSTLQKNIEEFQELFKSKISESINILNLKLSEVQNELNNLIEPSYEMQTEQDLINLTNYVNYGFNKNINQTNPKRYRFLNQILQLLDYQKFEEHLINISNQMEQLQTQSQIEESIKLVPQSQIQIDQKKHLNLRYQCQKHKSEITMLFLEPGQIEERFFCQNCIKEKNKEQLKTIIDVNKLWQSHLQNVHISNQNFYDFRQVNQNKVNELIIQYQKYSQDFFNELHKQITNQDNKIIKEKNDLQSSILNKQLYQMELKEIQFITQTLSQSDPMQEVIQKQFLIQKEDKQYVDQILEQLNLQTTKLMEIQFKIKELFQLDLSIQKLNNDQMQQYLSKELFPQFFDKYTKFQSQYKLIINNLKSKYEISQIKNKNQESNHQKGNQISQCEQILEQIQLIEKVQLKQISLSTHNLHKLKFQIKKKYLSIQNLHIQEKHFVIYSIQLMFNKINEYKKKLRFSEQQKHPFFKLSDNRKIAFTQYTQSMFVTCLCDQPIPFFGSYEIDFKIKKLYNIFIGICKSNVIQNNLIFNESSYYILCNYNYVYSHHDSQKNYKQLGFQFNEGDIINVEVNQSIKQIIWRNKTKGLSYSLEFQPSEDLHFCCGICCGLNSQTEVEII